MEGIAKNRRKAPSRQKKGRVGRKEPGEKYQEIVEKAPQGIMVLQDGRLRYANARVRDLLKKPIEELTPEVLVEMVHPDDRPMVLGRYAQRLRGEEVPKVYSFRVVPGDGRIIWAEISGSLIEWEGRPATLMLVENITGQKKLEAELRESERTIRALLDASPAVEFLIAPDGKILTHDQAFEQFFGREGEPLVGRNIQDLLSPEEIQVNRDKALEVLSTGKPVFFEDYQRGIWLEKNFIPIVDEEGGVAKIACWGRDISKQKQAADALKESELRYRLLAENATDFIWTMDWNLRLTYVSPGITRLRGYTPEEVMAEPLEEAFTPDSWALIQKVYAEELAEEQKDTRDLSRTRTLELEHRCKDGSTVWGESKISAIRDAEGKIAEILGVTRDITERKKAEEASRRWAEENALMAEITRVVSYSLNIEEVYERFAGEVRKLIEYENLTVVMINPGERSAAITHVSGIPLPGREAGTFFPLDGTAAEEIYETRSSLFIPREKLEKGAEKFPIVKAAFEAGMQSMIIVPLIRKDQVFGVLNIFSSRPDAYTRSEVEIVEKVANRIADAIANARLFQELQRTLEALKESEQRNRDLVEAAGISGLGIVVFKNDGRGMVTCQFANEEAQKISGYTEEELSRIPFPEMVHPAYREIALSRYWTRVGGDQEPVLYHLVIRHKQGHTVLIEVSVIRTVFRGEDCMIGFFRDISERERTEKELADYRAHLEQLVEERTARINELEQQRTEIEKMAATGVLAARIAHEINNPLAGIKGSFMLVQDAVPKDHAYHHYIERIHGEINRIARIVRQMFELYRVPEYDPEEWGLEQMVQDIVALLKDEARERKVSFQLPVLPVKVRIPAGPIRQVLFNVIKNAVEASPVEGRVRVSAQGGEKEISIQVADEGHGISEKNRPHIFKPFFSTKKGRQKGLGLGLSISKEIVESLGGTIRVQNLREKGLLCQIDLPKRKRKKENTDD